ncbi:MAG TPA: hypothetical protein VMU94_15420 [Streptosporangiaceae bacterium]|nr:hypothetical protein [Streptosporangiaceae bacterium]
MHRKRSRSVLGSGFSAALSEKFAYQIQASEVCAHQFLELRSGQ